MAPFLEKALAPVFRALGVQKAEEQDYPAPLLVRNTFIDMVTQRSVSLDGFFEERAVSSSPASMIDGVEGEELKVALPKADGSSSCRSTSAGSSSGRSGAVVSPGGLTEASAVEHPRVRGLPEFDYPAPVFVKNTFIHADIGRPPSLDTFFDERHLRSCPASVAEEAGAGVPGVPVVEATPLNSPTAWVATALVPALIPVQVLSTTPSMAAPGVPDLQPLLSHGSAKHRRGRCKPCAHVHTAEGCKNGLNCTFCHLCPPGELKRRQKERRKQKARLVAVRKAQAAE